jgi:hypothetical protein
MMKRLRESRNERGIAMVTVLFIGAALTAVTSVATFATINEFRAGSDDRKAAEALSYAEAGIDRMIQYMKSGKGNYNTFNRSGCPGALGGDPTFTLPTGAVGNGTYSASVTVYNPFAANPADRFPPAACAGRPISPHPGQDSDNTYFVITSTGTAPQAVRKVRQIVSLQPIGLPVGMFAENFILKAHPNYVGMTMQANGIITDRKNDEFDGNDPYYKIGDFFPSVNGRLLTDPMPAAAHAGKGIYLNNSSTPEFTGGGSGTKNCSADRTAGRSIWDSDGSAGSGNINSGCSSPDPTAPGFPSTSKYTAPTTVDPDHAALKDAALSFGVYCSFPGFGGTGTTQCLQQGVAASTNYVQLVQNVKALTNNFVAYFEFRSGTPTQNNLNWDGNVWGCNDNPALNHSIVVDIRNGGFYDIGAGGDMLNGALILDGDFNTTGQFTFNGTFLAKGSGSFGSSSETVTLDPCWVKNFPAAFYKVVPGHWAEVDR